MNVLWLKIGFMVFWLACFAIRYPFSKRTKKNTIVTDKKTTREKTLLGITFIGMMVLPLLYVFTPWLAFADYAMPLVLHLIGALLVLPCLWLFYRSHSDLGQNWSATLEVRKEHTLVTNGVYKTIRHPMYSAIWIWGVIQALLLPNYVAGLSGILAFGLLYFLRVNAEEKMMQTQFGKQYIEYKKKTKRLIPNLF